MKTVYFKLHLTIDTIALLPGRHDIGKMVTILYSVRIVGLKDEVCIADKLEVKVNGTMIANCIFFSVL